MAGESRGDAPAAPRPQAPKADAPEEGDSLARLRAARRRARGEDQPPEGGA
jgi:hypothetical protein